MRLSFPQTDFFGLSRDQLKQALSGTPAYSPIDPGAHEQGTGIIATVANATRPFLYLPPADGRPPWSALEWPSIRKDGCS